MEAVMGQKDNSNNSESKEEINSVVGTAGVNSSQVYAETVKFQARQGHGFAAEQANNIEDLLAGKDARVVGNDNTLNGPDRYSDGTFIQTKYCKTAQESVDALFDDKGYYKYKNADGSFMPGEIPKGQGEEAVALMEKRISEGRFPGVSDPNKAKELIREGAVTYEQAINIQKFGTVEGLIYDAKQGCIAVSNSAPFLGVGAALVFCKSIWDGKDFKEALKNSCLVTLNAGGFIGLQTTLVSGIARTGIDSAIRDTGISQEIVKLIGPDLSKTLFHETTNAAASKVLRGNVITMGVSVSILSVKDFYNFFSGDISFQQLSKNILQTSSGVAGAIAGASIGSAIPVVGTIVGGFLGGMLASKTAKGVLDEIIEDDAKRMLDILQNVWANLSYDYMLSESEAALAMAEFKTYTEKNPNFLKDIFHNPDHEFEAKIIVEPIVAAIALTRPKIKLPSEEDIRLYTQNLNNKQDSCQKQDSTKKWLFPEVYENIQMSLVAQIISFGVILGICFLTRALEWNTLFAISRYLLFFVPLVFAAVTWYKEGNGSTKEMIIQDFAPKPLKIAGIILTIPFCMILLWGGIGSILAYFGAIGWLTFWDAGFTLIAISFILTIPVMVLDLKYLIFNRPATSINIKTDTNRSNLIKKIVPKLRSIYLKQNYIGAITLNSLLKDAPVKEEKKKNCPPKEIDSDLMIYLLKVQGISFLVMVVICLTTWFMEWNSLFAISRHLLFFVPLFLGVVTINDEDHAKYTPNTVLFFMAIPFISLYGTIVWGLVGGILAWLDILNWLTFWDIGFTALVISFPFLVISFLLELKSVIFENFGENNHSGTFNAAKYAASTGNKTFVSNRSIGVKK
jgi:MFS family permease